MLEDWIEKLLILYQAFTTRHKKALDNLGHVLVAGIIAAFGLALVAPPLSDFFESQRRAKNLTPTQVADYQGLVSSGEDPGVVKAAHELFKREDVAWVSVRRGDREDASLEVNLKKTGVGFSSSANQKMGAYDVRIAYAQPAITFWSWSQLREMHGSLAVMAGGLIILVALVMLLERLTSGAIANTAAGNDRARPTPFNGPRAPDPLPPEPTPPPQGPSDNSVDRALESSGLRLIK
jgi:hypothetical protein